MKEIGIVIVNYNGKNYQNACIKSLYEMDYQNFEIIVVDSASTDNSIEILKAEYPDVHVIQCDENVGVAVGNNIGIEYSRKLGTKYTLLSNNDIEVDHKMLSELVKRIDGDAVIVPKIYYYEPNDLLWYAGGELDWKKGIAVHWGLKQKKYEGENMERYVTYSPTCCMLIPNTVFDKVGYMDEKFFMYYDDTDFCVRLGDNDIKIKYVPSSVLWHKVSSSSGGSSSRINAYYMPRNQLYYLKKHKEKVFALTMVYVYLKSVVKWIISPIHKNHKNDKYILEAYKDYFTGKMGRKDFS